MRHYHCTQCDAVVADLVLADGTLADAIRMTVRDPKTVPTWIVVLTEITGEEAEATAPVVALLPMRGDIERVAAPAFERQMRKLRSTHCPPKPKAAKKA
jgi:hypothetical protein